MKVLLTGAAGFIGSAIGDLLTAEGHEVLGVDAFIAQAWGAGQALPDGVQRLDVREAEGWIPLLRGVDVVCHQAALVGAGVTVSDLPAYAAHNDLGTAALLAAMHEAGVRGVVFASSMVVYGEGRYRCPEHGEVAPTARDVEALAAGVFENPCPTCGAPLDWKRVTEDARLDPRSGYAASKVAQEHYASAWARQVSGRAIGLRYHNVYGPRMPKDTPYSGVAAVFRSSLERGQPPRVFEDGGQMRDFVHVSDVARANLLALQAVCDGTAAPYAAYNVCSGSPISIAQVARMLGSREPEITGDYRLGDVRHIVASPDLARTELGFTAEVGPAAGLREFAHAPLRG